MQTNFVQHPQRTQLVLAYKNPKYIADLVLPRVPVDLPLFTYLSFPKDTFLKVPDSKPIGRKGATPEIDYNATEVTAAVDDYAFDNAVPRRDQKIAAAGGTSMDPKQTAAIQLAERLALQRENRVATLMTSTSTYASGNTTTLSGTSQWSDQTNSDPQKAILTAMDGMIMRPNKAVMGELVATQILTHPKIVKAWNRSSGDSGKAPLSFLAELLGLDEILVGQSVGDTSAKGQTPSINKIWGKAFALYYQAPVVMDTQTMTFGFTAEWDSRGDFEFFDPNKGTRGSDVQRVAESVREIIMAPDLGYLFAAAIA